MGVKSKTGREKIIALALDNDALELRKTGMSYTRMGEELNVSRAGAYLAVTRGLARLEGEVGEKAEEVRTLELARLDKMLEALWPNVLKGNTRSVEKALAVMARRSKYLGLDMPDRVEHRVEISERQGQMLAAVIQGVLGELGVDTSNPQVALMVRRQILLASGEMEGREMKLVGDGEMAPIEVAR